jgi:hypothetical protein
MEMGKMVWLSCLSRGQGVRLIDTLSVVGRNGDVLNDYRHYGKEDL